MKRLAVVFSLVLGLALVAGPAQAKQPKPPTITGGGVAENFNAGGSYPDMLTHFGFNARATGEGTTTTHPLFGTDVTTYPARGQFQVKNVLAADHHTTLSKGHGQVVCIANLGPSSGVDGGGNPTGDVWEIRVGFTDAGTTFYGSFLVQDNGKTDYEDESFANSTSDQCGQVSYFELEPVVKGNVKMHD